MLMTARCTLWVAAAPQAGPYGLVRQSRSEKRALYARNVHCLETRMLVAIHQPTFFPWLGYLHRMAEADLFVILDHVQFERRNYQNRTMIRLEDDSRWLTVPVVQLSQKEKIVEKMVDNPPETDDNRWWGPNSFNTLKYAYRKAPFFETYAAELRAIFHARWDKLVDLDMATLEFLRKHLDITTPLVKSSTLSPEGQRSELLLDICQRVGASAFL